jgi:hypothetical protein
LNKRQTAVGKSFILNIRHKRTFVRLLYRTADAKDSSQSIARIDRTARKVDICRTFVRAVLQ